MKQTIYEFKRLANDNICFTYTNYDEQELIDDGAKRQEVPTFEGREVGLFFWNFDKDVETEFGPYAPQAFYPTTYEYDKHIYMVLSEIEDLRGTNPLDRFIWKGEDPKSESDLHKIFLEG